MTLSATERIELAGLYGFDERAFRDNPIGGNSNVTFIVPSSGRECILRISPPGAEYEDLAGKLRFQHRLVELGSAVVRPLPSVKGRFVERWSRGGVEERLVTVFELKEGRSHELLSKGTLPDEAFRSIGSGLAALHADSAAIGPSGFRPWYEGDNCFRVSDPSACEDRPAIDTYFEYRERCMGKPPGAGWGTVHGDLHFSNIIVGPGGEAAFCDFDDVCEGPYAMDMAMIVFDLAVIMRCEGREAEVRRAAGLLLDSYNARGSTGRLDLDSLEDFMKLLEASLYIEYLPHRRSATGGWLRLFFEDRRESVVGGLPYLQS